MKVYLDYAATTPVDPLVFSKMKPYFSQHFGNSASTHYWGKKAREALEKSRLTISRLLKVQPEEIIFTSSATESNNFILKGIAEAYKDKGRHLIISQIEHPSILETGRFLEKNGFRVSWLAVDDYGLVNPEALKKLLSPETILVSIMHVNNEIGVIEPLTQIGKIIKDYNPSILFHTDASQSFGKIPLNLSQSRIDLLTASSHKIYGPKGAALAYLKKGIKIEPLLLGGGQEFGLRSSTSNVPAIVGFAEASQLAYKRMSVDFLKAKKLRQKILKTALALKGVWLNGHPVKSSPYILNLSFDFIEGDALMNLLNEKGIAVSTGSACSSEKLESSHVLSALKINPSRAHSSLRISLGRYSSEAEINYFLKELSLAVQKLRKISPFKIN